MQGTMLRIGIVGTGRVAQAHLEAVRECKEARLVAVCDTDESKARKAAGRFGADTIHTDFRALAADPQIDAAIVCLPNHLHHPAVMELASSGKHVLVEKPMAMNLEETDQMIRAAETAGVTLMVGHSRRFSRAVRIVRERMPEIGSVFRIDISFLVLFTAPQTEWWTDSKKAGPLVIPLQGSHSIDTIAWLLNKIPDTVYAFSQLHNPEFAGADETNMIFGFSSGEIASVQLSLNTSPYVHETLIAGDRGSLKIYEYPTAATYGFHNRVVLNDQTIFDEDEQPSLYANELTEFLSAIRENREPEASGKDVRRTMRILDAACRSSLSKRPVSV